jgi:SAM-dependent methyltransferase
MAGTVNYYENNAERIAANYEAVDFSSVLEPVVRELPQGASVIDLGCGSGRDAAKLLSRGFEVTVTDASRAMLEEAVRHHPELSGRTVLHALPAELPFPAASFGAALAMAVLMHIASADLPAAFAAVSKVVRAGGLFAYSVNTEREGLNASGNDARGRHFTPLPRAEWEGLHREAVFETLQAWESEDITGRKGIRWVTFICRRP